MGTTETRFGSGRLVRAALTLGVALVAALTMPAASAAPAPIQWQSTGGDTLAAGLPPSQLRAAAPRPDGFALFTPASAWLDGTYPYTISLRAGGDIEKVRPYAQVATSRVNLVGPVATVGAGTVTRTVPLPGEILVGVTANLPCGSGNVGCGAPTFSSGPKPGVSYVNGGQVWIHPIVLTYTSSNFQHVVFHEIAHALGLHHYDSTYLGAWQMMHSYRYDAVTYAQGDFNGFAHLFANGSRSPYGSLDQAVGMVRDALWISGWAIDPDAPTTPTEVHLYVDGPAGTGWGVNLGPASQSRPDVGAAYPGTGSSHGFSTSIALTPGRHTVYLYGINIGVGRNVLIRSLSVDVPATPAGTPLGAFELAQANAGGSVRVAGWTMDPDAPTKAADVHVYVDNPPGWTGWGYNLGPAALYRPDVAAAYPGAGSAHGFDVNIAGITPGRHVLFVYAINNTGAGGNPLLRTIPVVVPA